MAPRFSSSIRSLSFLWTFLVPTLHSSSVPSRSPRSQPSSRLVDLTSDVFQIGHTGFVAQLHKVRKRAKGVPEPETFPPEEEAEPLKEEEENEDAGKTVV